MSLVFNTSFWRPTFWTSDSRPPLCCSSQAWPCQTLYASWLNSWHLRWCHCVNRCAKLRDFRKHLHLLCNPRTPKRTQCAWSGKRCSTHKTLPTNVVAILVTEEVGADHVNIIYNGWGSRDYGWNFCGYNGLNTVVSTQCWTGRIFDWMPYIFCHCQWMALLDL